jgi:hypothetical protein
MTLGVVLADQAQGEVVSAAVADGVGRQLGDDQLRGEGGFVARVGVGEVLADVLTGGGDDLLARGELPGDVVTVGHLP